MEKIVKTKLLAVSASGAYAQMQMGQIDELYAELKQFMAAQADGLGLAELYELYDLHVHLSLITGHDTEAKVFIDRIVDQFGDDARSERIKLLQSLYLEATGKDSLAAQILSDNNDELKLSRRLVTLTRRKGPEDYIKALLHYLDLQSCDLVAWAELGHEYAKLGHYDKAIFSFKEVLLHEPLAYPIWHQVGLMHYYIVLQNTAKNPELLDHWAQSRDHFLRAIEICADHKASWVALYVLTTLALKNLKDVERLQTVSAAKVCQLHGLQSDELKTWIKNIS